MTRKIYDMPGLPPLENCYVDVHLYDIAKKKPLGRINDVLIMVNNNLFPLISLLWILNAMLLVQLFWEDLFLRTVGAIIDMKEGTIRYQFPLKKGMEHFPRKRKSYLLILSLEQVMMLMLLHLKILNSYFLRLAQRR
jgi:hypothetical protein